VNSRGDNEEEEFMDKTKVAIRASTQDHLDIEDIQNDLILLKDGSCALVLEIAAVNFGLLSEKEQGAMIFAYAALLNSLTFPVQIMVKSTKKDISRYINLLNEEESKQKKQILKARIGKYKKFIESIVSTNKVLDKKFYIILPFSALELGAQSAAGALLGKRGLPFSKNYIFEKAKTALNPKRDHLVRQMARLGLKARQLTSDELIDLFFKIYNYEVVGKQRPEGINGQKPLVETL